MRRILVAGLLVVMGLPSVDVAASEPLPTVPRPLDGESYYLLGELAEGGAVQATYAAGVVFHAAGERLHRDGTHRVALARDTALIWNYAGAPPTLASIFAATDNASHAQTLLDVATLDRLVDGGGLTWVAEFGGWLGTPLDPTARTWDLANDARTFYDAGVVDPGASLWGASIGAPTLTLRGIAGQTRGLGAASWGAEVVEVATPEMGFESIPAHPAWSPEVSSLETWDLVSTEQQPDGATWWWYRLRSDDSGGDASDRVSELALAEGLAVPVATRESWQGRHGLESSTFHVIASWTGTADIPWGAQATGPGAPAPQMGPASAWGPQDGGSGLAYPLDEAIAAVRADPTLLHLRTMELHGQPVLVNAFYEVRPGGTPAFLFHEARWNFKFEDAQGKRVAVDTKLLLDVPGAMPANRDGEDSSKGGGVTPAQVPPTLPTVADAVRGWHDYGQEPAPVDSVVYSLQELTDGTFHALVSAGRYRLDIEGVDTVAGTTTHRTSFVSLDQDGRPRSAVSDDISFHSDVVLPVGAPAREPARTRQVVAGSAPPAIPLALAGVGLSAGAAAAMKLLHPAYTRIDRGRILRHPLRRKLLDLVEREPGLHFNEAQRRLEVGVSTLTHHAAMLEREGLLRSERTGGFRRLYPGRADARATRSDAVLRHPRARALLGLVRQRPGITLRRAARELGVPASSLQWHVARLVEAGVLERRQGAGLFAAPG